MSETITRERLNEIVNQLATVILGALDAAPADGEDSSESETAIVDTRVLARTEDEKTETVDVADMQSGTLILLDFAEYFRCRPSQEGDWMSFSGEWYTNEEFAEKVHNTACMPMVVHWG
jgi:hypothetical protein|nr:MAG TPA: hypothetical protein [Caudoviricetes sp.]